VADRTDEPAERAIEELFYTADRIALVDWDQFSGAKPTVLLTGVVTALAFVTGLSNLSLASPPLSGPLAPAVPAAALFARFGGVLIAFLLGIVTVALQRRKRLAWRAAMFLLAALVVLALTTLRATDVPLLAATLLTVPLLVRNRDSFDQRLGLSPLQIASLSSILGVGLYGTVGAYGLRGRGMPIESWSDAVYYVVVTISTVGYGDVTPTTPTAKWFSLSIILFGTGAFTVAVGALVGPAIESRMASAFGNMTASDLNLLEDHVVVLGYGDLTEPLLDELAGETDLVVVTPDASVASSLDDEDVNVLTGDPGDEDVLRDARVEAASGVVVGSDDDAEDVMAILAVRNVDPEIRIVAAATEEGNVEKLRAVGTDEVIDPLTLGGRLLGQSVLDTDAVDSLSDALDDDPEE
jgi:voltage-gated potassium channel